MEINFTYMKELENFIQILMLGMVLSFPVCFAVESFKTTGIAKKWFYLLASIIISAFFGIGFAMTFTQMSLYEGIWLSVCIWLGSQGFYEKLKDSNGIIGKMFTSVSELGENKPVEEPEEIIEIPEIPALPQAEKRDISKAQLKVLVKDLRVRATPAGEILGYAEKGGFYAFSESTEQDGVKWYKVGTAYIGDSGDSDIKVFKEGEEDEDYLIFPVNYVGISGGFTKEHPAIDFGFSNAYGGNKQPIIAPSDMKVVSVGTSDVIGKYIRAHATVGGKEYTYRFIHLSSYSVAKGDMIRKGEVIGRMGNTGSSSGGYHLHFDIWNGHVGDLAGTSGRYEASVNPLAVCYLDEGQTVGEDTDKKYKILRAE